MKPQLKIESISVHANGRIVYSQNFHDGLNVIAGDNGTGKSSILEFIAFALGYEEIEWKKAQAQCDFVVLKVEFSGKSFYMRRQITSKKMSEIQIKDSIDQQEWTILPYRKSTGKRNFSSFIFEFLGIPEAKSEENQTLTMFQILRLIYADQLSKTNMVMNQQSEFDNKGIRRSISEFLLGFDELDGHLLRQGIIQDEKKYLITKSEIESGIKYLRAADIPITAIELSAKISNLDSKIASIELAMEEYSKKITDAEPDEEEIIRAIQNAENKMIALNNQINEEQQRVSDSKELLGILRNTNVEISQSSEFFRIFSSIEYEYCPQCFSKLSNSESKNCVLCHSAPESEANKFTTFYFERQKEVDFQVQESESILARAEANLTELRSEQNKIQAKIEAYKSKFSAVRRMASQDAQIVSSNGIEIGRLIGEKESLIRQSNVLDEIQEKQRSLSGYKEKIAASKERLKVMQLESQQYQERVMAFISSTILKLISNDGGYEVTFQNAREAILMFEDSRIMIDGATSFSASSGAVLKAAARFAIFFASLEYDRIRIPRFSIIDCMEDKGMLPARAHNLQKAMLELLETKKDAKYQLIVATSMPCDDFLSPGIIVNHLYPKGTHTLDIQLNAE